MPVLSEKTDATVRLSASTFKIFFLCEDHLSLTRAAALEQRLAKNCGEDIQILSDFCEFPRLCHPKLREKATASVLGSDLIIIAADGMEAIPFFVQNWMNEIGDLSGERIACAEFLATASSPHAANFHQFIEKWVTSKGGLLFSNLFLSPLVEPVTGSQMNPYVSQESDEEQLNGCMA